ncbi:hypothetical protein GCM10027176_16900 [Actinoallomurus bryophytorum]
MAGRRQGAGHLLLGLFDEEEGLAARALAELGVSKDVAEAWIVEELRFYRDVLGLKPQFDDDSGPYAKFEAHRLDRVGDVADPRAWDGRPDRSRRAGSDGAVPA